MASTLNHIMNTGAESLGNSRVGVDVTGHNIANAHTAGYSRQRVNLEARHPIQYGLHVLGQGAKIQTIERMHDKFVEAQLRKEIQSQGQLDALSHGLSRLEGLFSPEMQSTIRDRMNTFFNSVRELANMPDEPSVRMNLVENATALAQAINATHSGVAAIQADASEEVANHAAVINQKLQEVASLNQSIKEMSLDQVTRPNDLEDRRDRLVRELSELVDTNTYKDENDQLTIRGPGGTLLVEGVNCARLETEIQGDVSTQPRLVVRDFSGTYNRDVTGECEQGKIAGLLKVRDRHAQEMRDYLNTFARGFAEGFNAEHRKGYGTGDYAALNGRDFFEGVAGTDDPAGNLQVSTLLLREPSAVGTAMSAHAPGDNVVANNLVRLCYEPIFAAGQKGGETASALYDRFVGKLGVDAMHARESLNATNIVKAQLESQREQVSGVSLDEEAANLLKYQHLFTASSRIITTADEMFKTVLDLKR